MLTQIFIFILSFFIVSFGGPAWLSWLGALSSLIGFALFWSLIIQQDERRKWQKFLLSLSWFSAIQMVQLSWLLSHPFLYIYFLWIFLSLLIGTQFAFLSLLVSKERIQKVANCLALSGIWVFFEWSRLFLLSGYSLNPVGLSLSGFTYSLQMASLLGVFGLSFWVIFQNLLFLRWWTFKKGAYLLLTCALLPYVWGFIQLSWHENSFQADQNSLDVALVQTFFPIEENMVFRSSEEMSDFIMDEWRQILTMLAHVEKTIDLIVLPEYVVLYGTYIHMYPLEEVQDTFRSLFGKESLKNLPPLKATFASLYSFQGKEFCFVNNAYWLQGISNIFQADVLAGLEDHDKNEGKTTFYSTARLFRPGKNPSDRYEKRILLPMGEYIPFSFLRDLAARYGVTGSFTQGVEAKAFRTKKANLGISICYEETFGDLMRECREKGAEVLVNLTNDGWYPISRLPRQHLENSRPRTVEMGIPLIRACNTGITSVIDCFGRDVAILGENDEESQSIQKVLVAKTPLYNFPTLYTYVGDKLILSLSFFFIVFAWRGFFQR